MRHLLCAGFLLCLILPSISLAELPEKMSPIASQLADSPYSQWLWIDTAHKKVAVMDDDRPVHVYHEAAFGRGGIGQKKKRGDNITPKGIYKIGWLNDKSSFRLFYGLTYPSVNDARIGLEQNLISQDEFSAIETAHKKNKIPPQNTALGGSVGIHGLGPGRLDIHQNFDWTKGCIALTNKQIVDLSRFVKPGMIVMID